jgi:hypothetical protein
VDIGLGAVEHYGISVADVGPHLIIDDDVEADQLTGEWSVHNAGVDVFLVLAYAGQSVGVSPLGGGPCQKDVPRMDGSVVAIEHNPGITAQTLAHELGHYLGLWHHASGANLMFKNVPNGGQLDAQQADTMRKHCAMRMACR